MAEFTIGIDIGTTGTKTVLVDIARARIVAQATGEAQLFSEGPGQAEADPAQWLDNVYSGIRAVLAESGVAPDQIAALSTTGMVPAVVPVDTTGAPVRRAMLQNDARATAEITELKNALDADAVLAATGSAVTQQSVGPTALWLQRHEPETWSATSHLVGSYDWVLMALGAPAHVELNWALESGLGTVDGQRFEPMYAAAGLAPELVPPVLAPGTQAGELSAAAAAITGLPAGLPLIVGGADHVLSAYAAGINAEGDWLVKLGGAGDILAAADSPVIDARLYLDAHPVPGRWLPNGCMATSGSLIRWFQTLSGGHDLVALDDESETRRPAEILCLPYFLGEKSPLHDPDLRGAFVGLDLVHTRADMYRSVLEAIAYGFKHHTEVFASMGVPLRRALVTNGGSRSVLWKQILADVLGTPLSPIVGHPGASLGAAVIAAVGTGLLDGWDSTERFQTVGEPVLPDPRNVERYAESYAQWRELGDVLTPISHRIARKARS
ncbi:FGGY-family carbohydrate kinase [Mycolicibacterium diernhoferi]|uniref:Carbohydrate kinase n=3 Tax=Mycolicibacterium diernhoferi TaxID=1801 RepID=A0A1Q4HJ34_9MYCO|nr:FGGY family carbohydrate kinase [Mycolicibacterium diernhoferi]OJZ67534.1 carbohydrate kinase [Mycolicibacterium diernhoferi]PEG55804.1 carbohydrate kinase [Mycolicibacterium diernhoferi]QYL25184.1 carbohydrate kinase [Mycolicibacterium diernhoferi]